PSGRPTRADLSEPAAAREAECLLFVVIVLAQDEGVVEAQRTHGRLPQERQADRGTDNATVAYDAVIIQTCRRRSPTRETGGGALVVRQRADVGEHRALEADFRRNARQRELDRGRAPNIKGAAKSGTGQGVTRTVTARHDATHQ